MVPNNYHLGHLLVVVFLATCLAITQTACSSWGTTHSIKDDESNVILINLNRYGNLSFGHSGFGREIAESYHFDLKPIKREYYDNEIKISRTTPSLNIEVIQPVKGSLRFNADYTVVTIDIKTEIAGALQDFPGNGAYSVNKN
jgi:hypothetical protein